MMFFKRCSLEYNLNNFTFSIAWLHSNTRFISFLSLYLKFFYEIQNKKNFFLNVYTAIRFFCIKKFLELKDLYTFRVLKIYGLGFKVSQDSTLIKLDMG